MLQIDLKKANKSVSKKQGTLSLSGRNKKTIVPQEQHPYKPLGLNSYNSLNRATRIRNLAKIIDDNKQLLGKLQNVRSVYSNQKWKQDY